MTISPSEVAKNPFFRHDINELCLVCNKTLEKNKMHSILDNIPSSKEPIDAISVLQSFTKFNNYDIISGPQNMCSVCFKNTSSLYKFQAICKRGLQNIIAFITHEEAMKIRLCLDELESNETLHVNEDTNDSDTIEHIKIQLSIDNETTIETSEVDKHKETVKLKPKLKYSPFNPVQCKVCLKMYKTHSIKVHMRTHTGEKPFKCKHCPSTFSCSTNLRYHLVTHSNDRPYLCKVCGASFKLVSHLRKHEMGHTGVKPLSCDICGKRFTNYHSRNRHKLIHSKEKPFQCEVCAKTFNRQSILNTHLKMHSGIKEHQCFICGHCFTQPQSLRAHMKTQHDQDVSTTLNLNNSDLIM